MGPGDGIQIQRLMDLPTTLETADSVSNPNISSPLQATQATPGGPGQATVPTRVKSMFQQQSPGGKLPSRLPSHHPQRSISHNEVRVFNYFKLFPKYKSLFTNNTKRGCAKIWHW